MTKALGGLLVIDTTSAFWASLGLTLLADFGADVIKVEARAGGRRMRAPGVYEPDGWNYLFDLANRNKRSLAVDATNAEGAEILRSLIAVADAFVTDEAPGQLEGSEWSYDRLTSMKPDLVYAVASGFGPLGIDRDTPALDELAAGRTGMLPILPQPGQPPVYPGTGQMYSSVMLALGIMTALNHRRKTGEGQRVDVSLLGGNMYGASLDLQAYLAIGGERFLHPISRMDAGNPMSGPSYPSADGRWVTLTMPDTGRYWPQFAEVVGLDPDDPRFDTHEKRCEDNRLEMIRVLDEVFRRQPADHWRSEFIANGLSGDVIEDFSYPTSDPEARENRYIMEVQHPGVGRVDMLGFPIFMSDTPASLERLAPGAGQDTAEILCTTLNYDQSRISRLRKSGVIS
ncbi:MAG TPA: CoA transferase [Dehalococcoidia bacterium]|nr:CoA transferase [Dehalococcoidia bacterium]